MILGEDQGPADDGDDCQGAVNGPAMPVASPPSKRNFNCGRINGSGGNSTPRKSNGTKKSSTKSEDEEPNVDESTKADFRKDRVGTAALEEAETRLMDVFGFRVRRVPVKMEEDLPSRFKNRLYLINEVADDEVGTHTLNIHSAHMESMVEKGVLMMILAFVFCKGTSQVRSGQMKGAGKKTRWISEHHLYSLLHRVDENIPSEPPSVEGKKRSRQSSSGGRKSLSPGDIGCGIRSRSRTVVRARSPERMERSWPTPWVLVRPWRWAGSRSFTFAPTC